MPHRPRKRSQPQSDNRPSGKRSVAARSRSSRRVRAARAGRPFRPRRLRDAIEPRFKFDDTGNVVPDIRAEAAIIYNPENGKVLWESNSTSRRSIASITKVMTAVVFLENSPDLTRDVVVERADVRNASTTYLRAGYTRDDRRPVASAVDWLRQRRGSRARAGLAVRVERIHRADEQQGAGARSREHVVRGPVGSARRQPVIAPTTSHG